MLHYQPTKIIMGAGCTNEIGNYINGKGKKALLLLAEVHNYIDVHIERIKKIIEDQGIEVVCNDKTFPNPSCKQVQNLIDFAKENEIDLVVAIGGGSTIDTAKVVSYCRYADKIDWEKLYDESIGFMAEDMIKNKRLPIFAIPTTAGTGSQVTQCAVISDENGIKRSIFRKEFFPDYAFVDSLLSSSMPKSLTACTGYDAFCHLSESYIANRFSPIDSAIAWQGMSLVSKSLRNLIKDPKIEDRTNMSLADTMGGISLSNGGALMPHAVGELITSVIPSISHGASLAITYPIFVEFYYEEYKDKINDVLEILYPNEVLKDKGHAKELMIKFINEIELYSDIDSYKVSNEQKKSLYNLILSNGRIEESKVKDIAEKICKL